MYSVALESNKPFSLLCVELEYGVLQAWGQWWNLIGQKSERCQSHLGRAREGGGGGMTRLETETKYGNATDNSDLHEWTLYNSTGDVPIPSSDCLTTGQQLMYAWTHLFIVLQYMFSDL